jgi:transposase
MPPDEIAAIEAQLEPSARLLFHYLRGLLEEQKSLVESLKAQQAERDALLKTLTEQLAIANEQNDDLKRRLFGPRSERIPTVREEIRKEDAAAQLTVEGAPMPEQPALREYEQARLARRKSEPERQRKRALRKGLPVVREAIDVTVDQLPEGYTLEDFRVVGEGQQVERIEHVREHLVVQVFQLQTLALRSDDSVIVRAKAPPGVVEGAHYGPALHAHVAVSRCEDVMPFHRASRTFERAGLEISRSTLGSLFHRTAAQLSPIYDALKEQVRSSRYVNADETSYRVQDEGKCRTGWVWTILSSEAVVYHFSDHRDSTTAITLLGDTEGYLCIDGYSAYSCLEDKQAKRVRVGCWGHARRKLFEARGATKKDSPLDEPLTLIRDLYRVEQEAVQADIKSTAEHLRLRTQRSRPLVAKLWAWIDSHQGKHAPKSKLAVAITYCVAQRANLERFLHDPRLDLDNNMSERALRIVALGRKNSLFAGHSEAAQNLAILHSIVTTCRLHDRNPYDYIADVLVRVQTHPASRIEELLPWNWQPPKPPKPPDPDVAAS